MSCCEKLKIERLRDLTHASVLASQEAHLLNRKTFVVKRVHGQYGEYYIGVPESKLVKGEKVYNEFWPGKSMKSKTKTVKKKTSAKSSSK